MKWVLIRVRVVTLTLITLFKCWTETDSWVLWAKSILSCTEFSGGGGGAHRWITKESPTHGIYCLLLPLVVSTIIILMILILNCVICVSLCHRQLRLVLLEVGHGAVHVCNNLSMRYAQGGKRDSAQVLTRNNKLFSTLSQRGSWTRGSCFRWITGAALTAELWLLSWLWLDCEGCIRLCLLCIVHCC